eukprot:CAMPEP_0117604606 /NCGR_PEP_ID=MMETSP0784-20121206/78773_1 /TAXON_ID=39447 /ORGANISM="" /LENGTH=395 /DNA_ID=CAMNT_0005407641 /DNA_START=76 /DNA_END=1263 /DNA_ORIENTATION=+
MPREAKPDQFRSGEYNPNENGSRHQCSHAHLESAGADFVSESEGDVMGCGPVWPSVASPSAQESGADSRTNPIFVRLCFLLIFLMGLITIYSAPDTKPGPFESHGADANLSQHHWQATLAAPLPTNFLDVLPRASAKAVRSGLAGFFAGTMQVLAFMWLRTAMNYQYKFGGNFFEVLRMLYREGGIARLYQGLPWAIVQNPVSKFGTVFANDLALTLLQRSFQSPISINTLVGSLFGALWRILITPIDVWKTVLQTDGLCGQMNLKKKIQQVGVRVLWAGWEANYVASVIGNYPWFVTVNVLQEVLPMPSQILFKLNRSAVIGAIASSVSDLISNSVRVVKTIKQTHADVNIGYIDAAREVVLADGASGLGLEARVYTNVLQGAFFNVVWKCLSG